ncbi:hypothetical protein [Acidovorax sp. sic0104]|uniref:hypothetical protein n=1 Tax=Acidovorax sp. sic0104 TaxID=2854784 RepID=UPI001C447240|nr:hypothetical protein [Acidovorax sp. sic0104]MBV7542175.1 hypothetical protein [Acidovorax sp. sic0104]
MNQSQPRNVTILGGIATLDDGTTVDLTRVQAALNAAFSETGDRDYMRCADELAKITGLEETACGFLPAGAAPAMSA